MCDPAPHQPAALLHEDVYLEDGEVVLAVDDFVQIADIIQAYLQHRCLKTMTAGSVAEFRQMLKQVPVALVLLDINLPDGNGADLIPEIKAAYPDTAVIMLSGVTDLQTALKCIRHGADDYLTKPVQFEPFWETVRKVLEKRRLKINNRRYQKQIEQANFRLQLMHELSVKMNTAYLSMNALDEILRAILVGITAEEGLGFNRAFLALFDDSEQILEGRMAIGPGRREDALRIWQEINKQDLSFHDLIDSVRGHDFHEDSEVNRIVRALRIESADKEHLLFRAASERRTINVCSGQCDCPVPVELMGLLEEDSFVVVPLFSQNHSLGVIIADNFVTGKQIDEELVHALESFASQASLAIEHWRMYMHMEHKINELETVTEELDKNKDMLVEAERYAAVGQVAAQLAHNIRNPVTAIGGTARLLSRKISDPQQLNFLSMMIKEAVKIEHTLEDLLNFVDKEQPAIEQVLLYPLLIKSLMLFYSTMQKQGIEYEVIMIDRQLICMVDPKQMRQVFVHLIRNAVEAMEQGGKLIIEAATADGQLRIAVRDSGLGIAEADIRRATDPFYTTKIAGTGVGLALVQRVIKDHNGSMIISRRPSGGTKVALVLPG
ncbi:MAG: GAF sensor signal transduction histidine kinase [Candidatus Electronema aureum]|uniref:histidine kinase n=1 Tax=Candidatus Electronema aureum TaxID=2005002 RepID=A0A521G1Z7_9BACT|nr:MAG: GAF sensor signal transduction histidine kinase [Candidatus Electronema aureum]